MKARGRPLCGSSAILAICMGGMACMAQDVASTPLSPTSLPLSPGLSASAAAKVDSRILLALAQPQKTVHSLSRAGRFIVITGERPEDPIFPVLILSHLQDAELAALGAPPDSRIGNIVTSRVHARDLETLAGHPLVEVVEASYRMEPFLDVSIPEVRADLINGGDPPSGYSGTGVLYGLLDDGIDWSHEDFKDEAGGSRILYIWDHNSNGQAPAGFSYGTEYTKAQIDAGQATVFVNDGGHGSHVAGISVGDGSSLPDRRYRGVAWNADIIAVRNGYYCDLFCYGESNPMYDYDQDTKGAIDGLNYMIQKRTQLGKPLVVNESQGVTMGPHDGTTLFEQAYEQLITQQNLIICIAAGNDQQSDWHGRVTVPAGGSGTLVVTKDNSETAEGWMAFEAWNASGDRFRWEVTTPGGETVEIPAALSPPNQYIQIQTAHADTMQYWSTASYPANSQGNVSIYVQNTRLGVQGGAWTLRAIADNGLPAGGQVDLYCERNQYTVAVTQGVSTESIVGMPGTVTSAITVASYNTKNQWMSLTGMTYRDGYPPGDISRFSSWGPRRDGAQKPDIGAPGAYIMSVFAAGSSAPEDRRSPDGPYVAFSGTSMASPHVAGAVALMLEKDPNLTPSQVKSILQQTARTDGHTGAVPNAQFGYGKLDVKAAVDAVGGASNCATRAGDANTNGIVDILDVISTVNDILLINPLGPAGRACANMDGNSQIDILDLLAIVNVILTGGGASAQHPVLQRTFSGPKVVSWSEERAEGAFRLGIDADQAAGLQMTFILPRGFELGGEPALLGAGPGCRMARREIAGQQILLAYNLDGGAMAGSGGRIEIEIPLLKHWDGGQGPRDIRVTSLVVADASGRSLPLALDPAAPDPLEGRGRDGGSAIARTFPNPMKETSRVTYTLDRSGEVAVTVLDGAGRRVRTLWRGWQMSGDHSIAWDGKDEAGRDASDGAYFIQLAGGGFERSRKMLLIRR